MILVPKPKFQKALRKLTSKNPQLRDKIKEILMFLEQDPYAPA
jgi:mRNA-degrading endonuclease YafQ of YafQ-DinJ toxin-antitoxin module